LANAARNGQQNGLTANRFSVLVHPHTMKSLQDQESSLASVYEQRLMQLGEHNRWVFAGEVKVEFRADATVEEGAANVVAAFYTNLDEDEPTAVLNRKTGGTAPLRMAEAFLIINGRRHVMLAKAVNRIGRSLDNDIVLENSGVSREHAQIRWRNGRFEIFDLGSKAGTQVNGRNVSRFELKSGDVVTLGTAALIFGEEELPSILAPASSKESPQITQQFTTDESS
jgi:hypothetical protein